MSTILITGASGFLGRALGQSLAADHSVIALSRHDPELDGCQWVRGDFADFEYLRQLDGLGIDGVVHLAAVTGGCFERDGILVNVEGTRRLMQYLVDAHGCMRFVLASSTAVVGFEDPDFMPVALPIPDEHPCLDRHGYGVSKYLMEEISRYVWRQHPEIGVINLRLAAIHPDDNPGYRTEITDTHPWAVGSVAGMGLADTVRALTLAIEAAPQPGVRIFNCTAPKAWATFPIAELFRHWWGDRVDLSCYEHPGHEYDSVYDVRRIEAELGFRAEHVPPVDR